MSDLLLTQVEACRLLGRSPKTVRRWARLGVIPTFTDASSGTVWYPEPALRRWAEQGCPMVKS